MRYICVTKPLQCDVEQKAYTTFYTTLYTTKVSYFYVAHYFAMALYE